MEKLDCVVIGAGVIGLAVARAMALAGREVFILEKTDGIGNGASSRNSEVIHAGMYYPTGSKKASLCVQGGIELYRYCEEKGINHRKIGKLIVASSESDMVKLNKIAKQAEINKVVNFSLLDRSETLELEPSLNARASIFSPLTGIVDSHALMKAFLKDAEDRGAIIVFASPVEGGRIQEDGIRLDIGGHEPMSTMCRTVINCAGIETEKVLRTLDGFPEASIPKTYMCKGNYFAYLGTPPFSRLIYPVPDKVGLGVHLTFDLAGQGRFGPDTEWVTVPDYHVDENRANAFYAAIRRYWPDMPTGSLGPAYSGIRAMLRGPEDEVVDFLIQGPREHGVPGVVNLFGIESPGLTASMAIADDVVALLSS